MPCERLAELRSADRYADRRSALQFRWVAGTPLQFRWTALAPFHTGGAAFLPGWRKRAHLVLMIGAIMNRANPTSGTSPRILGTIAVRRCPNWRELRKWALREAAQLASENEIETVHVLVPGRGAQWVFQRLLRERIPSPGAALPEVTTAEDMFRNLAERPEPPFRVAAPLAREILTEEALLAGAAEANAPPGDPEQLCDALLAFLDEQAGDRAIRPERPAFQAFAERARKEFSEAQETDEGAARLLGLTDWLTRVHTRYLEMLEPTGQADPDLLRRRLLAGAGALRPELRRWRVLALGEEALRPADLHLLSTLFPGDQLVWALTRGAPDPPLPRGFGGFTVREIGAPDPIRQPTLFSVSQPGDAPSRAPATLVPEAGTGGDKQASLVFRATDREEEIRVAGGLVRSFAQEAGSTFPGYRRCAIAAQRPLAYLEAAEALLPGFGIPFETALTPRLTAEPWVASVADVLEFAERPGRLSRGLTLLRGPFFHDPRLPGAPRAADILAEELPNFRVRDTNEPGALEGLAERLRNEADRQRGASGQPGRTSERRKQRAEALEAGAAALERLADYGEALRPLREPETAFTAAIEALIRFLDGHLLPPEPPQESFREAVFSALRQAADAAPAGAPAGGAARFHRRIRRLLHRRPRPALGAETSRDGVQLIAARDAPFGDYDFLVLVGMVDTDWPGPRPENIFFPHRLLEPGTRARHNERRDREIRLLRAFPGLAGSAFACTRPELEDGFPVGASSLEAELSEGAASSGAAHRPTAIQEAPEAPPAKALPPLPDALERRAPSAAALENPVSPTALDTYARSPAQFFARYSLRLKEERQLADVPPPTERGTLLHAFLEKAFRALPRSGTAIEESSLEAVFERLREEFPGFAAGHGMHPADRRVEERWLFGGDATPSALLWFLREEAARGPGRAAEFESWVEGEVEARTREAPALRVHGRLDRLDDLPDGSRRVVEYKSGRFYQTPLQPRLYARIIEVRDGRNTSFAVPYFGSREWVASGDPADEAEQDQAIRGIRDALAHGEFPAPEEDLAFDFALVVRKDLKERHPGDGAAAGGDA